jgi:hypothetical protein
VVPGHVIVNSGSNISRRVLFQEPFAHSHFAGSNYEITGLGRTVVERIEEVGVVVDG